MPGRTVNKGTVSWGKTAVLLDFVQMREGGRALPKFVAPFHKSIFVYIVKSVYFLQNANDLNFKLFFKVVYKEFII